jgi:hypothetical protein
MGQYLNKPTGGLPSSSSEPLKPSGEWPVLFPALCEFLLLSQWEDGTSRLRGSITLFADPSSWKCCLNDKDGHRVAFVAGSSPEDALMAAEAGIVHSTLDWRDARPNGKRKPAT